MLTSELEQAWETVQSSAHIPKGNTVPEECQAALASRSKSAAEVR